MNKSTLSALCLALLIGPTTMASAQSQTFQVRPNAGSRIQFVSTAPLETITGVSSHVSGDFTMNPGDLSSMRGTVRVRVASIRTGIDLRDEHLRGPNWLGAGANPNATFEITRVEGASTVARGGTVRVRLHGRFSIHGVTRPMVANARVRLVSDTEVSVRANFRVRLTDHNVSVPLPVRLKVSNEIRVNVRLSAHAS